MTRVRKQQKRGSGSKNVGLVHGEVIVSEIEDCWRRVFEVRVDEFKKPKIYPFYRQNGSTRP
jgi:predicted metalloprotease